MEISYLEGQKKNDKFALCKICINKAQVDPDTTGQFRLISNNSNMKGVSTSTDLLLV